ncbi:MAG: TetR/AcrR family transcriptional regulator, partial [Candidatus Fermentibacteraceae bacterium]|nr:TetR/AcrR family transcriptional regulator [Candidatus Fermentibacteraceae bacterium]
AEEFAEKGFSGARVDEIARRAGINKAMLYYRIGDKEELYRRVILRGQKGMHDAMLKAIEATRTAPETVAAMLAGVTRNATENRLTPSIMLREIAGNGKTLPDEGLQGMRKFMNTIRSMVTMGVEEGSFRSVDPVTLQFLVTGAVFTLSLTAEMRQRLSPENPGPVTPTEIAEALGDIIYNGIVRR